MTFLNISAYKFLPLNDLENLRETLLEKCYQHALKGTILLSPEGINLNLSGNEKNMRAFMPFFQEDKRFCDLDFRKSYSALAIFKRLKIKIKQEIITLRCKDIDVNKTRATMISPTKLKQWLETQHDFILLDTRNTYEIKFGTFKNAVHLGLENFCEFPSALSPLNENKPIVLFCTGGIRCEKAALVMQAKFPNRMVYQLEGGILNYFEKVGGDHYTGECYVFDERIAIDAFLRCTEMLACSLCQGPISRLAQQSALLAAPICASCVQIA